MNGPRRPPKQGAPFANDLLRRHPGRAAMRPDEREPSGHDVRSERTHADPPEPPRWGSIILDRGFDPPAHHLGHPWNESRAARRFLSEVCCARRCSRNFKMLDAYPGLTV